MNDDANRTGSPPEDFVSVLWRRVKEHRVAQWTVGYVAVAYGIQHAVTLTSEAFEWPNIVTRVAMLLLALGLPIAMTLAWYHGERASQHVSGPELTIISILLVGVTILFNAFVSPPAKTTTAAVPVQEASVTAARKAAANPRLGIALAVLPFANESDDKQQEYFSDGITEEITAVLAKIPDLAVVARTSAFQFKGQNRDIQAIGRQLNATHLIEGSVRKAGDRLRISAALVRTDSGVTIWSDSYDRQLADVFAIQEDIARSIASSLHMTLGLRPGARLVPDRIDETTHEQYLRARALYVSRSPELFDAADKLVAAAPNFAPAQALKSDTLLLSLVGLSSGQRDGDFAKVINQAEEAAQKAIQLDPELADGYSALAAISFRQGKWADSLELHRKALALDPDNPESLEYYRQTLEGAGYIKEALRISRILNEIDPLVGIYARITGQIELANGIPDGATTIATAVARGAVGRPVIARNAPFLAAALAGEGRLADAAQALEKSRPDVSGSFDKSHFDAAARILLGAASKQKPSGPLPDFAAPLNFVYIYAGVPERMLEWPEKRLAAGDMGVGGQWWPMPSEVRQTPRFKKLVREAGLVDFWRNNDWPDLCRPTTGDDFECN